MDSIISRAATTARDLFVAQDFTADSFQVTLCAGLTAQPRNAI